MAATKTVKKSRGQHTAAQWHEALQRFKTSGLSVQAFCAREGLSQSCFYRRKSAAAATQDASVVVAKTKAWPLGRKPVNSGFVDLGPLQAAAPPASTMEPALLHLNLRIDLGGGLVLRLERA